jgi:hypothetical protein
MEDNKQEVSPSPLPRPAKGGDVFGVLAADDQILLWHRL